MFLKTHSQHNETQKVTENKTKNNNKKVPCLKQSETLSIKYALIYENERYNIYEFQTKKKMEWNCIPMKNNQWFNKKKKVCLMYPSNVQWKDTSKV